MAQDFIVPEITATELVDDGSRFKISALHHRNRLVQIRIERRPNAVEWKNAIRFQQRKKFLVNHSQSFRSGLSSVTCPLHCFIYIVDNIQEWEYDLPLAFLRKLLAITLNPAAIVLEISQRTQVSFPLNDQDLSQSFNFTL